MTPLAKKQSRKRSTEKQTKLTHFDVAWRIDIWAKNHREAALQALKIQRDSESVATCFDVAVKGSKKVMIDLLAPIPQGELDQITIEDTSRRTAAKRHSFDRRPGER